MLACFYFKMRDKHHQHSMLFYTVLYWLVRQKHLQWRRSDLGWEYLTTQLMGCTRYISIFHDVSVPSNDHRNNPEG